MAESRISAERSGKRTWRFIVQTNGGPGHEIVAAARNSAKLKRFADEAGVDPE